MGDLYIAYNGAAPTTAALAGVSTTTAIRTMLQVATPATQPIRVVWWGCHFTTAPTAPVTVELIEVAQAATVTAHVAAGVQPYGPNQTASLMTLGTAATGYTATAEGTVSGGTRYGDYQTVPIGVSQYQREWSLGREWWVPVSRFLRIRMTTATALNAVCWLVWEE